MTTPDQGPAARSDGTHVPPAEGARPDTEAFALSPGLGALPRIYVSQSPADASTGAGLWRITVKAALWACRQVSRHLPNHRLAFERHGRSEHTATGEAMTDIPADLRYSEDHLWARTSDDGGPVRVGVTDFAQVSLGDVVDVTLPRLGEAVKAGEPCGVIESTKSVNDLVAPVTGTVTTRNDDLAGSPDLVNSDPYGQGWMFDIEADPATLGQQVATLMDAAAYRQHVGE